LAFDEFSLRFGPRKRQRNRIVVLFFEIFGDGAEIDEEEEFFLVLRIAEAEGEKAGAAAFDLNVFRREKLGA